MEFQRIKTKLQSYVTSAEKGYDGEDQKPSDCNMSRMRINFETTWK